MSTTSMTTPPRKPSRALSLTPSVTSTSLSRFRSNVQPTLDELKLSHILNGETCPPISFHDFASFVTHKEFTTENLLFVVWFRSYQARYRELDEKTRERIPIPSTKLGDRYSPFAYLDKAMASSPPLQQGQLLSPSPRKSEGEINFNLPFGTGQAKTPQRTKQPSPVGEFKPCSWTVDGRPCSCGDSTHQHPAGHSKGFFPFSRKTPSPSPDHQQPAPPPIIHTSMHPNVPPPGTVFLDAADQPMRDEAQRAFATFLKKGGSRELGIPDELRQYAKTCLARSTAPEVFLPIYDEIYHAIETQSLPHFLTYAKTNINRPKQIFWFVVGTIDFLLGVVIYLILTLLLSRHHFALRATRLPAGIFSVFGAMQFYSATRGFCNQVWGRSSRQVRPWEMDEYTDEEAAGAAPSMGYSSAGGGSGSMKGDEELFSPLQAAGKGGEVSLSDEVHPMTDLSGSVTTPMSAIPWAAGEGISFLTTPSDTQPHDGAGQLGEDLSESARRQLAIRRATVKVPDASLAFPISDAIPPPTSATQPASPFVVPSSSALASDQREISPFDASPEATQPHENHTVDSGSPAKASSMGDLTMLLSKFQRTSKEDRARPEKRPKTFGPERLVEDPRIKRLYQGIVRDILIVGGITGVAWVVLCLAVPTAGLL